MNRQDLGAQSNPLDGFIRLGRNSGIPLGVMGNRHAAGRKSGLAAVTAASAASNAALSDDAHSSAGESDGGGFIAAPRVKGETADEKRSRKADVKEAKVCHVLEKLSAEVLFDAETAES